MSTLHRNPDLKPGRYLWHSQRLWSQQFRIATRPTLVRTWDMMHSLRYMRHAWLSINASHTAAPLPIRDALAAHHRAMREIVGPREWRRRIKIAYGL